MRLYRELQIRFTANGLKLCKKFVSEGYPSRKRFKKLCQEIINDFDNIETLDIKKPRVGIVGEILVKFLPAANNHLVELLESEGAEAVVPDLLDFLLYCFYNQNFKVSAPGNEEVQSYSMEILESKLWNGSVLRLPKHLQKVNTLTPPAHIEDLAKMASEIVSLGNQTGEGWFLTGEMLELIHSGSRKYCLHPAIRLPAKPCCR